MNLKIQTLANPQFNSNCYILTDWDLKEAIIIDPASEKSEKEIEYIANNGLRLAFVILTHGHVDHAWGANSLKEAFPDSALVYSENFEGDLYTSKFFLRLVRSEESYEFVVNPADINVDNKTEVCWGPHKIRFVITPGHSPGSMCIDIDGQLFTGDTIMPAKQFKKAKDFNLDEYESSVSLLQSLYSGDAVIYPGHGEKMRFKEWINSYR